MKKKILKVKIPPQDLRSFGMDKLNIDPFWYDVYGMEEEEEEDEKVAE